MTALLSFLHLWTEPTVLASNGDMVALVQKTEILPFHFHSGSEYMGRVGMTI